MRRPATTIAALLTLTLAPAAAHAEDPLLSGYGGPGGGEQVVLGSKLIGGDGGSRSMRVKAPQRGAATAAPRVSGAAAVAVAAPTAASATGTRARRPHKRPRSSRGASAATRRAPVATPTPARPLAPVPVAAAVATSGGLPLTSKDIVLLAAGLAAAALAGLTAARVRRAR